MKLDNQLYRLLVHEVKDYAIYMLDCTGVVMSWNIGGEIIGGYKEEEIVGKHFSDFFTAEDQQTLLPQKLLLGALKKGQVRHQGWATRKDGTTFWADVCLTAFFNQNGNFIGYTNVTCDRTSEIPKGTAKLRKVV